MSAIIINSLNCRYRTVKAVEVSGQQASPVVFSPLASCQKLARNLRGRGHLVRALVNSTGEMTPEAKSKTPRWQAVSCLLRHVISGKLHVPLM